MTNLFAPLKKAIQFTWNSPSLTSWGSQLTQALRLFLVTPLILTKFGTSEIAAWFLFGSLILFGEIINSRMDLTFTRMIAFCMGGATNLGPIKKDATAPPGTGSPNWSLLERVYGTIGYLNVILAIFSFIVAASIGWYGLQNILNHANDTNAILIAFALFILSKLATDLFRRYDVSLIGTNHIALRGRWDMIVSIVSVGVGLSILILGGNIWQLVLGMQGVTIMNIFRMRFLVFQIEESRFRSFKPFILDRDVINWAKEPFFKGLALNLANSGLIEVAAVIYARHSSVKVAAAYLFSMRILNTARQFSGVPFFSHAPRMSRLIAEGKTEILANTLPKKILLSQGLYVFAAIAIITAGNPLLGLIHANSSFLPPEQLGLISVLLLLNQYNIFTMFVSAMANDIICFERTLLSAVISICGIILVVQQFGLYGVIIATYVPMLVILNIKPIQFAAERLNISNWQFFKKSGAAPITILIALVASIFLLV